MKTGAADSTISKKLRLLATWGALGAGISVPFHAVAGLSELSYSCGDQGALQSLSYKAESLEQITDAIIAGECTDVETCKAQFRSVKSLTGDVVPVLEQWADQAQEAQGVIAQGKRDDGAFRAALGTIQDFLEKCRSGFQLKQREKSQLITLQYPFNGPLRNFSARYSRQAIQSVVRVAVANRVDPYLALAVVMKENTTALVRPASSDSDYAFKHGLMPIDGGIAYSQLGCIATQAPQKGDWTKQARVPTLTISRGKNPAKMRLCAKGSPTAIAPVLVAADDLSEIQKNCCVDVFYSADTAQATAGLSSSQVVAMQAKTALGMSFLKQYVQGAVGADELSSTIQRFNGKGCFDCAEHISGGSSCLSGVVMGERPVYGAQTADLMANVLMSNPDVRAVIEAEAALQKQSVASIFCLKAGAGEHTLSASSFLEEQRKYLTEGSSQNYSLVTGRMVRKPASPAEQTRYQAVEAARSKACSEAASRAPVTFAPWRNLDEVRAFRSL